MEKPSIFSSGNAEGLTHLDETGAARMVDVGAKAVTERIAQAQSFITMKPTTLEAIVTGTVPKGDVLPAARIAGIMAAKHNADLIPLCHPLPLEAIAVELIPTSDETHCGVRIVASIKVTAKTGAEMEALTAASVAALTVYDMCKALERGMEIGEIHLLYKSGGKSGEYRYER